MKAELVGHLDKVRDTVDKVDCIVSSQRYLDDKRTVTVDCLRKSFSTIRLRARMVAYVNGTVNQELLLRNEYLGDREPDSERSDQGRRLLVEVKSPDLPMSSPAVSRVLQELLPPATRGRQVDSNSTQSGGDTLLTTDYERLSIRRICSSESCVSSTENQDLRTLVVFKRDACPKDVQ